MRSKAGGDPIRFIEFQLPTLAEAPPEGDGWLHEIKYDGCRGELLIEHGTARGFARNGHDWSAKYGLILEAAASLPVTSAIIDGEVIVMDETGLSDLSALRTAMRREPGRLVFVCFDLLHLNGKDLRPHPLIERRMALSGLIEPREGALRFSQHVLGSGLAFYREVERQGFEGMVSKQAYAPYRSGRSESWLKVKCYEETDYEVAARARSHERRLLSDG